MYTATYLQTYRISQYISFPIWSFCNKFRILWGKLWLWTVLFSTKIIILPFWHLYETFETLMRRFLIWLSVYNCQDADSHFLYFVWCEICGVNRTPRKITRSERTVIHFTFYWLNIKPHVNIVSAEMEWCDLWRNGCQLHKRRVFASLEKCCRQGPALWSGKVNIVVWGWRPLNTDTCSELVTIACHNTLVIWTPTMTLLGFT